MLWSTAGKEGPWQVRVVRAIARLLGVEFRMKYRWKENPARAHDCGEWDDCQGGVSLLFNHFQEGDKLLIGAKPALYLRTKKDRAFSRELDKAVEELKGGQTQSR